MFHDIYLWLLKLFFFSELWKRLNLLIFSWFLKCQSLKVFENLFKYKILINVRILLLTYVKYVTCWRWRAQSVTRIWMQHRTHGIPATYGCDTARLVLTSGARIWMQYRTECTTCDHLVAELVNLWHRQLVSGCDVG